MKNNSLEVKIDSLKKNLDPGIFSPTSTFKVHSLTLVF